MSRDLLKYQAKSITPVDEYVCTLSDELQKIAKDELRETEEIRRNAIQAMRDWALENPRIIKCRLDSKFLLKALRFRKFSIPMAQEHFERYLLFREENFGYDFFSNLDPLRPNLLTLLERGFFIPLPKRDKSGRCVIMLNVSQLDPSIPNVGSTALALATLILETLIDQEENQIRGFNYIADFSGMSAKQVLVFPLEAWFKIGKNCEKTCALRHKHFNIVNLPQSITFFMDFAIKHMPEKLQKRTKLYTCSVAETGLVEFDNLPVEYGGKIPMKDITDEWKKILISKRDFFVNYQNMAVNRNLYPKEVLECNVSTLKTPINQILAEKRKGNIFKEENVHGSFRKLEID